MDKEVLDNKCPACNASISFNPTLGKWKCEYCGSEFSLEEMKKYNNASNDKYQNEEAKNDDKVVTYTCQSCGAEIVADENTAATFCVYCGNTAILKNKLVGKFAPNKIIPFKKEKSEAIRAFKGLAKGRPFMPKSFINENNIEKITGVYIPFWLFGVKADGSINFEATRVHSWSTGDRHYTKTDYYDVMRECEMQFYRIPVDGATRFDDDIMNTLEPFNYKDLVDYNHAYLSGFLAEKYDVPSNDSFKNAATRALNSTKDRVARDLHGYSSTTVTRNNLKATQSNLEYALLPVWMVNIKYKNKYYIFAMNGQTGEFIGNAPVAVEKVILYFVCIMLVTFGIVLLGSYVMHLMGII